MSLSNNRPARLDGSIVTLPDPDLFVFMYVRKEAVLSSQIEGKQASLQDLLAADAELFQPVDIPRDVDEVINYVAAMNYGLARLADLPVSVRLIREIHERLRRGVRGAAHAGGVAADAEPDRSAGSTLTNAEFVPPPPEAVPQALGELETFLHASHDLPLLVKIALAHEQFETIHPFPGWQRPRWATAHHVPAHRGRRAEQACALPLALPEAASAGVL